MEENLHFVVKKDCPINGGNIPVGTELFVVHGCVYMNGGLLEPFYQREIMNLVHYEMENGYQYLRREGNIYNKI